MHYAIIRARPVLGTLSKSLSPVGRLLIAMLVTENSSNALPPTSYLTRDRGQWATETPPYPSLDYIAKSLSESYGHWMVDGPSHSISAPMIEKDQPRS